MAGAGGIQPQEMRLRVAQPDDYDALGQLVYDAVHAEPSPYNAAQRAAWMPAPRHGADWHARLAGQHVVVAEDGAGIAQGFMSLEPGDDPGHGYVDFAYIRAEARGSGLFRRIYAEIEKHARDAGLTRLNTHASLAAQPAFAAMGFVVEEEEAVAIGAEKLKRFAMMHSLD
ncbi:MAG: GNAT family N-acetyltransferase [Pseudomonadota bacterium]